MEKEIVFLFQMSFKLYIDKHLKDGKRKSKMNKTMHFALFWTALLYSVSENWYTNKNVE